MKKSKLKKVQPKLLPDFGIFYFRNFGTTPLTVAIEKPFVMFTEREGYINFGNGDYLGQIICSVETAQKYKNQSFMGVIKPSIREKYSSGKDSILPFRIVEEIDLE